MQNNNIPLFYSDLESDRKFQQSLPLTHNHYSHTNYSAPYSDESVFKSLYKQSHPIEYSPNPNLKMNLGSSYNPILSTPHIQPITSLPGNNVWNNNMSKSNNSFQYVTDPRIPVNNNSSLPYAYNSQMYPNNCNIQIQNNLNSPQHDSYLHHHHHNNNNINEYKYSSNMHINNSNNQNILNLGITQQKQHLHNNTSIFYPIGISVEKELSPL